MKSMSTISPDRISQRLVTRHQGGFSIATAIFVIVILAALGAFLVTIGSGQQIGLAQDIGGIRVFQAARAGIDWGTYEVLNTSGTFRTACNGAGGTTATLPALTGMTGITVKVDCTSVAYSDGASAFRTYQLFATACNNATCPNTGAALPNLYVERRLSAMVAN